ncbi:DUF4188 domain-containing protein [Fodinicola acaciae]|uniref:DUF4188 domain-containing protein n=1 Tax=Fodinicola acaciae TaxID=2681555 RepID=UPI001FE72591|nr:DUF4188 domain-containing protein [Fodinicola acaciae]
MADINEGRWTAQVDEEIVVFLIGMRFNKLRAVTKWWPVFTAMPGMLKELMSDPESGLLNYHMHVGWRSITLVQYWRGVDDLTAYASDQDRKHRPAWLDFFRNRFKGAPVGFWHETYVVKPGTTEQVYGNMPAYGMAKATKAVRVGKQHDSARQRLAA